MNVLLRYSEDMPEGTLEIAEAHPRTRHRAEPCERQDCLCHNHSSPDRAMEDAACQSPGPRVTGET